MRLEQFLVLNRYFHGLFGASDLQDLKQALGRTVEGPGPDGHSHFFHALAGLRGLRLPEDKLGEYDARVVAYEARLAKARGQSDFKCFKYFQYLSLLYTDIFLDRLTEDPGRFLGDLNAFLADLKRNEISLRSFPAFAADDLRRLAFFMATGSGKTLLLHVNLWQALHYLERGRRPEALVKRADGRREFDTILLVTPGDGLSQQHLDELNRSGIDAALLVQDRRDHGLLGPSVKVIEIHKLAEEPSKDGVSVLLDELGSANLVFVDEGHKGTGSEARTWKTRQRQLSRDGLLLEYSATFAQSIAAASARVRQELLAEYGKTILFDYSYRHFYDDGYGKDFRVLNMARARESQAHELLLGGLLAYYQQNLLFRENQAEYHPYHLEKPLWVFLGSSVNAVYSEERQKRSDVATVVAFLRRFLEEPGWALASMGRILKGESGITDQGSGQDLFAPYVGHVKGQDAEPLYRRITSEVFHGRGALEIWELKAAEGELALRVSTPEGKETPYFGVINIGDVSAFKKHLDDNLGLRVREDRFTRSLFAEISAPASTVNVLVGAKKFIEGWSSWRVSTMGLLNVGKGEGPQVIQLFGRGVRLRGKNGSLKRSAALPEERPHPKGLDRLETLLIFGWNADYIQTFRAVLEQEDVSRELEIPLKPLFDPWPELPIPKPNAGYDATSETWTLAAESLGIVVDLTPRVMTVAGVKISAGRLEEQVDVEFTDATNVGLLNLDALHTDLLEYKTERGYGNVYAPRTQLLPILRSSVLVMPAADFRDPSLVQEGAARVLRTYLDRFVASKERQAEGRHLQPAVIAPDEAMPRTILRVSSEALLRELEILLRQPTHLYADGDVPLPRLHIDRHLFSPLLLHPTRDAAAELSVSPPGLRDGEARFVKDLRDFWRYNHAREPYANLEIYLLRNLPRAGVGFFRRSGFYPDFILWTRNRVTQETHVQFLEPHGMHHGGLGGNQDKIEAFKELEEIGAGETFRSRKITMSGYILTETDLAEIPDATGKTWEDLEREHRVLRQEGAYIERIIASDPAPESPYVGP